MGTVEGTRRQLAQHPVAKGQAWVGWGAALVATMTVRVATGMAGGLWGQAGQGCRGAAPRSSPCVPCPVTSPHASTNRPGQEASLTSFCWLRRFPGTSALLRVPAHAPAPTVPHSSPLAAPCCPSLLLPMPAVSLSHCHPAKSALVPAWHFPFPKPSPRVAAGLGRPRGCPLCPLAWEAVTTYTVTLSLQAICFSGISPSTRPRRPSP